MSDFLERTTLGDLAAALRKRTISSVELVTDSLQRIKDYNPRLNAFIQLRGEEALEEARERDRARGAGEPAGTLFGIPFSLKDLIETRSLPTTAGSRVFGPGKVSRHDALLVSRLLRAGAILLGKTNLHEFAYGVTNENAHFGPARNPWDPSRIAGGSSGGSATAVAARMGFFSIGTDTRGSIRIPSSFCGITGLKGTYGSVPTRGVIPLSWSLDHAGPMTRSVADAEAVFDILRNRRRAKSPETPKKLRIGICDYFLDELEKGIDRSIQEALKVLEELGHTLVQVRIAGIGQALSISGIIAASEAATYHDELIRDHRDGYGATVLARLETGFEIPAYQYVNALQVREQLRSAYRRVFEEVDCLAGASVPLLPRPIEESPSSISAHFALVGELVRLNAPQNVVGVPAMVVPCGFSRKLPVSLQLIAPWQREDLLFELGKQYQSASDWHLRRP